MTDYTATTATDTITGTTGDDTLTITNTNQVNANDRFDLGDGTGDRIIIGGTVNLTGVTTDATHGFHNIEALSINGGYTVTLNANQFGLGLIANSLAVIGNNSSVQTIDINNASNFSAAGWTFSNWVTTSDLITIDGTSGADTITGSSQRDRIAGGDGADTLSGGGGNDTFTLASGDFDAGESIDGGSGTDTISLSSQTVNFSTGSLTDIEVLTGSSSPDTVTVTASQVASLTTINLAGDSGGDDSLYINLNGSADFSGTSIEDVENFTLAGSGGADSITLTETQLNDLDSIALGGDTDSLTVETSGNFVWANSVPSTFTGVENITIEGDSTSQTLTGPLSVAVTIRGAGGNDTIAGSSAADTLDGGAGNDAINSGAGNDVIIVNAAVGSSSDSARVIVSSNNNDTGQDNITSFDLSNDTLQIVGTNVSNFSHGADTAIGTATGGVNDGTQGSFLTTTGLVELNQTTNNDWDDLGDIAVTFTTPTGAWDEANFEARLQYNLTGTGSADTITTGALSDTISGGAGNDTISGGAGVDTITGGGGDDAINSGIENDIVVFSGNRNDYTVTYAGGAFTVVDSVAGRDGTDTVTVASGQNETLRFADGDVVICFYPGTMIRTPAGEAAVETLRRGDLVTTSDGRALPVTWVGRQTVSTRFGDPLRVLPIRIKAGALGDNVPARDLLLSPDHAVLVEGALIQAGALVNGTSIVREANAPEVFTYYHVELDDHSLILAENAPAETFVDHVDRLAFDNWAEHEALYPEGKPIVELPYPRAKAHRQVPVSIRVRLAARALAMAEASVEAA